MDISKLISKYGLIFVSSLAGIFLILLIAGFNYDPLKDVRSSSFPGIKTLDIGNDFNTNYYAAKRFFTGDSLVNTDLQAHKYPFELTTGNHSRFIYHPFSALFFLPFSVMPYNTAYLSFMVLSIFAFLGALFIISQFLESPESFLKVALLLSFLSFPMWALIARGQTDLLILFFLVLNFYFFIKKKYYLSGSFLALAALFKLLPIIFLPYFFFKQKKVFISASIGIVAGSLLVGIDRVKGMLDSLSFFSQTYSTSYFNVGLFGFFYNKLTEKLISFNNAKSYYLILLFLVFAALLFVYRKVILNLAKQVNTDMVLMEFGIISAIMVLLPVVSWAYQAIYLFFIFAAYWNIRFKNHLKNWKIIVMDTMLFLILSELALFKSFQQPPLSILISLRPIFILAFIFLIGRQYLRNYNNEN